MPDFDANSVDRTLIRVYLRATPLECLEALEEMQQFAESVAVNTQQIPQTH